MNNAEKYKITKKVEEAEQGTERFQLCVQSAPRPRYLAKEYALPRHCVFVKYKQKTKKKIQIQSAPFQADLAKKVHYLIRVVVRKKNGIMWEKFPNWGGRTQTHFLMSIYQIIFGMPK